MTEPVTQLADLLEQTARAHHEAFAETDGEDPEWPRWYARHLLEADLAGLVGGAPDEATVEAELRASDEAYREQSPGEPWNSFYAEHLHRRLRPAGYS